MRILFAASDRDLLRCYERLLSSEDRTADTAFDGTQVLTKLSAERYDLLILSQDIQRVDCRRIVGFCNGEQIPVIVLTFERPGLRTLLDGTLANAYLPLPFLPDELIALIDSVRGKLSSEETLSFGSFEVKTSSFSISGIRVTAGELDALAALSTGSLCGDGDDRVCINALNAKLSSLMLPQRIRYNKKNGYRLVNENE